MNLGGLDLNLLSVATEPYAVARCFGDSEAGDISSIFIDVGGLEGGIEADKIGQLLGGRAENQAYGHEKRGGRDAETLRKRREEN